MADHGSGDGDADTGAQAAHPKVDNAQTHSTEDPVNQFSDQFYKVDNPQTHSTEDPVHQLCDQFSSNFYFQEQPGQPSCQKESSTGSTSDGVEIPINRANETTEVSRQSADVRTAQPSSETHSALLGGQETDKDLSDKGRDIGVLSSDVDSNTTVTELNTTPNSSSEKVGDNNASTQELPVKESEKETISTAVTGASKTAIASVDGSEAVTVQPDNRAFPAKASASGVNKSEKIFGANPLKLDEAAQGDWQESTDASCPLESKHTERPVEEDKTSQQENASSPVTNSQDDGKLSDPMGKALSCTSTSDDEQSGVCTDTRNIEAEPPLGPEDSDPNMSHKACAHHGKGKQKQSRKGESSSGSRKNSKQVGDCSSDGADKYCANDSYSTQCLKLSYDQSTLAEKLGFKEYCERACKGQLTASFDHPKGHILVHSSNREYFVDADTVFKSFWKQTSFCKFNGEQSIIFNEKKAARKFLDLELLNCLNKPFCFYEERSEWFGIYCFQGELIQCQDVLSKSVKTLSFPVESEELANDFISCINDQVAVSTSFRLKNPQSAGHPFSLIAVCTSNVADQVFSTLKSCRRTKAAQRGDELQPSPVQSTGASADAQDKDRRSGLVRDDPQRTCAWIQSEHRELEQSRHDQQKGPVKAAPGMAHRSQQCQQHPPSLQAQFTPSHPSLQDGRPQRLLPSPPDPHIAVLQNGAQKDPMSTGPSAGVQAYTSNDPLHVNPQVSEHAAHAARHQGMASHAASSNQKSQTHSVAERQDCMGDKQMVTTGNLQEEKRYSSVQIHEMISELLQQSEKLMKELWFSLSTKGISIEFDKVWLSKGCILILQSKVPQSKLVLNTVLSSMFVLERFCEMDIYPDIERDLEYVHSKYPEDMHWREVTNQSQKWYELIYHVGVKDNIASYLKKLKHKTITVPLPEYALSHVADQLRNNHPLSITSSIGLRYIELTVKRSEAPQVEKEIESLLTKFVVREAELDLDLNSKQDVLAVMSQHPHCTANLEFVESWTVLRAWSPSGHRLMVCEGSVTQANATALVLPLCDGQTQWPKNHADILEDAFLSSSVKAYTKVIGTSLEQRKIKILPTHGNSAFKEIVVMATPSNTNNKDKLFHSLKVLLEAAQHGSVLALALPHYQLGLNKFMKWFAWEIVKILNDDEKLRHRFLTVMLYTDQPTQKLFCTEVAHLDKHLLKNNWSTTGIYKCEDAAVEAVTKGNRRVRVAVHKILDMQGDVLVNSTDPKLLHTGGTVSKELLSQAGPKLTAECRQRYPDGICNNMVAVTDSHNLHNFEEIFHIVLPQDYWHSLNGDPQLERNLLDSLKMRVQSCLLLASAKHLRTIVFPSLGTGNLCYPSDRVAQVMLWTIHNFFREMPCSSLQDVCIACYPKDRNTVQSFKVEETFWNHQTVSAGYFSDTELQGAWFKFEETPFIGTHSQALVQLVTEKANTAVHPKRPEAIILCCNARNRELWQLLKDYQGFRPVNEKKVKKSIKEELERAEPYSTVYIMLGTFDPKEFQSVLDGVGSGALKKELHVVLVVPDHKTLHSLLQQSDSLITAGVVYAGATWNSSECSAKEGKKAWLQICGENVEAEQLLEKILNMNKPNPPVVTQPKGASDLSGSSVDPVGEDFEMVPSETGQHSKQMPGKYSFSIPADCLKEDLLTILSTDPQWTCDKEDTPSQSLRFWVDKEKIIDSVTNVMGFIRENSRDSYGGKAPHSKPQAPKPPVITVEKDGIVVKALQSLMGTEFSSSVSIVAGSAGKGEGGVKLECAGQEVADKLDSLRQEEVEVTQQEIERLPEPVNTTAEGVAAYMYPVSDRARVILFSFDYNELTKAKHNLNVKLGKVKVSARARRRFAGNTEGSSVSGASSSAPASDSVDMKAVELCTKSNIKVSVYNTDITKLPLDGIVNAANEHLGHGGGVAYAIARAAGVTLEQEGKDYLDQHGPLKVTEVVATTGGSLPCRKVLHAVGPRWTDYKDKALCGRHLALTVYNCLVKAHTLQLASLALPSISSAIFGVPKDVCADSYLLGVQSFEKSHGGSSCLRHIHFVDVSEDMIRTVQRAFQHNWHTDMQPSLTLTLDSEPAITPQQSDPLQAGARRPSQTPTVDSESATTPLQSDPLRADSTQPSKTPTVDSEQVTSPAQSDPLHAGQSDPQSPDAESNTTGASSTSAVESKRKPQVPILLEDSRSWKLQFDNLLLTFCRLNIFEVKTQVIVLWQEINNVGKDKDSKEFLKLMVRGSEETKVKDAMKKTVSEGSLSSLDTSAGYLVLPLVVDNSPLTFEKTRGIITRCLEKADKEKKATVTIPTRLHKMKGSGQSNKSVEDFAVGVYQAVKQFAEKNLSSSVQEIHVIHPDRDVIRAIVNTVTDLVAKEKSLQDAGSESAEIQRGSQPQASSTSRQSEPDDECAICLEKMTNPKSLECQHTFCTHCVDTWFKEKSRCPKCLKVHGILTGSQPSNGRMEMRFSSLDLPGFQREGRFEITYDFPAGKLYDADRGGDRYYSYLNRTAYLPNTVEGRKVLMLLMTAFERRLVFTVGMSRTTGNFGITWNDIHHKTETFGGPVGFGYPDPDYLPRVKEELESKGVTEKDLTEVQKHFISNHWKYTDPRYTDFSYRLKTHNTRNTSV